jgi:hypothetical protein
LPFIRFDQSIVLKKKNEKLKKFTLRGVEKAYRTTENEKAFSAIIDLYRLRIKRKIEQK